jgi:hypothetical protein
MAAGQVGKWESEKTGKRERNATSLPVFPFSTFPPAVFFP